jgi:UDP-N-acetylglucosamine:LPS N-acetylglucosamine transferase
VRYRRNPHFPPAHAHVRGAKAVISKPGGGTLLDSLAAATPVVLLAPWGTPEASNGALWEALGFGIEFERWRETEFDDRVLEALHHNLLEAGETHDADLLVGATAT